MKTPPDCSGGRLTDRSVEGGPRHERHFTYGFLPARSSVVSEQLFGSALREPPSNDAAEMGFLGAALADNRVIMAAIGRLRPEHFAFEVHGFLYREIARRVFKRSRHRHLPYRTLIRW